MVNEEGGALEEGSPARSLGAEAITSTDAAAAGAQPCNRAGASEAGHDRSFLPIRACLVHIK